MEDQGLVSKPSEAVQSNAKPFAGLQSLQLPIWEPATHSPAWEATVWKATVWEATVWEATVWEATVWEATIWEATVWEATVWEATVWEATVCKAKKVTNQSKIAQVCISRTFPENNFKKL